MGKITVFIFKGKVVGFCFFDTLTVLLGTSNRTHRSAWHIVAFRPFCCNSCVLLHTLALDTVLLGTLGLHTVLLQLDRAASGTPCCFRAAVLSMSTRRNEPNTAKQNPLLQQHLTL